jgi:hypothetical protein
MVCCTGERDRHGGDSVCGARSLRRASEGHRLRGSVGRCRKLCLARPSTRRTSAREVVRRLIRAPGGGDRYGDFTGPAGARGYRPVALFPWQRAIADVHASIVSMSGEKQAGASALRCLRTVGGLRCASGTTTPSTSVPQSPFGRFKRAAIGVSSTAAASLRDGECHLDRHDQTGEIGGPHVCCGAPLA